MSSDHGIKLDLDVRVQMRDGIWLSTDIYRPNASGAFPTVLMRTPYSNNTDALIEKGRRLAQNGYVCVIQDVRGRWDSEGEYYPFREGPDGYDTQEWIGRQPWCNGKIGTSGGSYLGTVQWQSARFGSSFLKCMAPRVICNDYYTGLVYPGGVFQLNVLITWGMRTTGRTAQNIDFHNWTEAFRTLPLMDMDTASGRDLGFWKDWIDHPSYDAYWDEMNGENHWGDISVPAFNMGGWYDLYAPQTFTNFNGLMQDGGSPEARKSKLIVGPWPHGLSTSTRTGDIDFGTKSMVDLEAMEMRWFDHWLKGVDTGYLDEPPLRLFIMGIDEWRDEQAWPLPRTQWQKWFLHSNGHANSLLGDGQLSPELSGDEPADHYVYDPDNPVQTVGGNNCCSPHIVPWGPYDQRPVEMRGDVLCYTSAPLASDLEVTGPIRVVLYAATDALDTDWTAKLVDVSPTGYAKNLCDGIVRARYRESLRTPSLLEPNRVYAYDIEVRVKANVFLKGHRIRLEISSSNFPRFDRNANTGRQFGSDTVLRKANQTIQHARVFPSHILLPVIPS
ncbi:MAG: CocE/NonD family hydrolase [bacterium]|nr:CocE/NonD family hydrolase [bacterium]